MKIKCEVYRCGKKTNTYLYLKDGMDLEGLPEEMLGLLGELTPFLKLELSESSKLARIETNDVLLALAGQGYYLQLPPGELLKSQVPSSGFVQ
jgi:uncharacterized protein YcgL (UPF0745 family)